MDQKTQPERGRLDMIDRLIERYGGTKKGQGAHEVTVVFGDKVAVIGSIIQRDGEWIMIGNQWVNLERAFFIQARVYEPD